MKLLRYLPLVIVLTFVGAASPAYAEDATFYSAAGSVCGTSGGVQGWCLAGQAKAVGVLSGGLTVASTCSANVYPSGSTNTAATAPMATQVTDCFVKTAYPNEGQHRGRTLAGNASATAGTDSFSNFASPVQVCFAVTAIFENNMTLREPATGVSCSAA
jgi:hypothetical protein